MAADKPQLNRRMLELLYADELGELDERERQEALQEQAAQSDEEAAEFAEFQAMLGRIRQEDLTEEVPESVHSAIMDSARRHAAGAPSRSAQATERTPRVGRGEQSGQDANKPLWARLRLGATGQIALVATVMLVAGAVFVTTNSSQKDVRFHSANTAVISEVTFGSPQLPSSPEVAFAEEAAVAPEPALDKAVATGAAADIETTYQKRDEADFGVEGTPTGAPTKGERAGIESEIGALAQLDSVEEQSRTRAGRGGLREDAKLRERKSRRRRASRQFAAKAIDPESSVPLFDEPSRAKEAAAQPLEEAAQPRKKSAEPMVKKAAAEPESKPDAPSALDAIEESFASAHYDEVLVRVDAYLNRASATSDGKAKALEFKARAQKADGDPGAALDTYERLHQDFPNYRPEQINREIARLRRDQTKMMRRRPARDMNTAAPAAAPPESESMATEPVLAPSSSDSAY